MCGAGVMCIMSAAWRIEINDRPLASAAACIWYVCQRNGVAYVVNVIPVTYQCRSCLNGNGGRGVSIIV